MTSRRVGGTMNLAVGTAHGTSNVKPLAASAATERIQMPLTRHDSSFVIPWALPTAKIIGPLTRPKSMNEGHVAIGVGSFATLYGLFCLFRMFAFSKWETTEGLILSSYKTHRSENFQKFEDAEVTYEYEVDGKKYKSSTIKASGEMSGSPSKKGLSEVDRLITKYPAGSNVTVYYNAKLPRMACLEQGGGEAMLTCLTFGPAAVAVGYFFLL